MGVLCFYKYLNGVATVEPSAGLSQLTKKTWVEALVSTPPPIHMVEASISQSSPMVEVLVSRQKVEASVSLTLPGVEALSAPGQW